MPAEWVAVAVGALAVVGAVLWRLRCRQLVGARLAAALRDPDPRARAAAVRVAVEQGLRTHDRLLAARVEVEGDPTVLAAVVEGVLRNAWEPADRPAILRLRLWAHAERARTAAAAVAAPDPLPTTRLPRVPVEAPVEATERLPLRRRTDTGPRAAGPVPPAAFDPPTPRHRARPVPARTTNGWPVTAT